MSASNDIGVGNMNFTFQLPPNWMRIDTTLQGASFIVLMPGHATDNFVPRMNVSTEFMHGKTHEEYIAGAKQYLMLDMDGVELLNNGGFTAGNYQCLWYSYNRPLNGLKRQTVFYSIAVNGISYNITAAVTEGGLQQYKPTFDKIVESFKLAAH